MSNIYTKNFTLRMHENKTFDVYDVLRAFEVTDPAIAHAVKKLLVTGGRNGGKSKEQDLQEALWSLKEAIKEFK
jgi:hypothetical protein